jgi:diguanylate cyclase (GGDEF)-like protein
MTKQQVEAQQLDPGQMRILLTLSRDLLQTDEPIGSLELVGRALVEIIQPDSALLLLRGKQLNIVEFDKHGAPRSAGTDHPLYPAGMLLFSNMEPARDERGRGGKPCEHSGPRTLALAVPAYAAIAVLAVGWDHELNPAKLNAHKQTLSYFLQLAAAALGKIEAHSSLERLVSDQRQEMTDTSVAHAAELKQRDEAATEMRLLSLTDVLTGLYNRRGFFLQAEQSYKLARRKRAPSAVIFADIDGLKRVNDSLGHDVGDRLIQDAALVFRQSFRQADVVARLGGDEFVAYTLDDEQPGVIIERIKANLHAFNLVQERPYTVAISAGVVQCDSSSDQTLSHYVLLADEQMYAQKRSRLH